MEPPDGYKEKDNMVWKLTRRCMVNTILFALEISHLDRDNSVYLRGAGAAYIMIGVYVDDLTIAAQPLTVTFLYSKNNSAIALAKYPVQLTRSKHILHSLHHLREMLSMGSFLCPLRPRKAW